MRDDPHPMLAAVRQWEFRIDAGRQRDGVDLVQVLGGVVVRSQWALEQDAAVMARRVEMNGDVAVCGAVPPPGDPALEPGGGTSSEDLDRPGALLVLVDP